MTKKTNRPLKSHSQSGVSFFSMLSMFFIFMMILSGKTTLIALADTTIDNSNYLNSNSVVLITGAAGFVGSELAMALHRTYSPKKIICVDSMNNMKFNKTPEEHLSLFDLKRQRVFHVMQTLGRTASFYRVDFRPSIPEYFQVGEVPILDFIFRDNPDITHVVHLADAYHRGDTDIIQAVPRLKSDIKAGMIESLMEQFRKVNNETGSYPYFTYASSYEVYNYFQSAANDPNLSPFREHLPITTPSSLGGTSKLIDEILTKSYFDKYGINSIGLRFFSIYGPWGLPNTPLYDMAERAVTTDTPILDLLLDSDNIRDYVYIDDAVDAIMAAMQFQSSFPHVVNVGSGKGGTLTEIANLMEKLVPREETVTRREPVIKSHAIADITRASKLLGYKPQVTLYEGIMNLLSWHHDRAFPYGGHNNNKLTKSITSCSPFDKECLRGAPIFPCASECSHETQCTTSYYNDVTALTMTLTEDCETVLYTVALSQDLIEIPSANYKNKKSHFKKKHCNLAFVSEVSPLVRHLKQQNKYPLFLTAVEEFWNNNSNAGKKKVLRHGFWTLVPLPIPTFQVGDEHTLKLLPKLSPGSFFGEATHHAIYCDPDIVFTNIYKLLQEAQMQPFQKGSPGDTALLVGHNDIDSGPIKSTQPPVQESIQASAYRMIRIGMTEEISSHPSLDSSWLVHSLLQNEDSRSFRCDLYGEIVQWDVSHDVQGLEFVVGLHDMWARVLAKRKGLKPWWIGDQVVSVPVDVSEEKQRRRLLEQDETNVESTKTNSDTKNIKTSSKEAISKIAVKQKQNGDLKVGRVLEKSETMLRSNLKENNIDEKSSGPKSAVTSKAFRVELESTSTEGEEQKKEEFERAEQQAFNLVNEMDLENQEIESDEETNNDEDVNQEMANAKIENEDMSEYDIWMGMLSSTELHYFVRIVPFSQVGAIRLNVS